MATGTTIRYIAAARRTRTARPRIGTAVRRGGIRRRTGRRAPLGKIRARPRGRRPPPARTEAAAGRAAGRRARLEAPAAQPQAIAPRIPARIELPEAPVPPIASATAAFRAVARQPRREATTRSAGRRAAGPTVPQRIVPASAAPPAWAHRAPAPAAGDAAGKRS